MKKKNLGIIMVAAIVVSALAYMYMPIFAQPGDANDPLVTRRYVDQRIAQLSDEVAVLRHLITMMVPGLDIAPQVPNAPGGLTSFERELLIAEIFGDVMLYFETMYGDMLRDAAANIAPTPTVVPFEVISVTAGTTIIFEAGVEFILRSGVASVIAGPNGLTDITEGRDIGNGHAISRNHLMLVPVTDGRGALFTTDAWIMIKGNYHIVG